MKCATDACQNEVTPHTEQVSGHQIKIVHCGACRAKAKAALDAYPKPPQSKPKP